MMKVSAQVTSYLSQRFLNLTARCVIALFAVFFVSSRVEASDEESAMIHLIIRSLGSDLACRTTWGNAWGHPQQHKQLVDSVSLAPVSQIGVVLGYGICNKMGGNNFFRVYMLRTHSGSLYSTPALSAPALRRNDGHGLALVTDFVNLRFDQNFEGSPRFVTCRTRVPGLGQPRPTVHRAGTDNSSCVAQEIYSWDDQSAKLVWQRLVIVSEDGEPGESVIDFGNIGFLLSGLFGQ